MKAVVYHSYGNSNVLKIEEVEKPIPNDDEALIRVCASSLNPADWYAMTGLLLARFGNGLRKPNATRLGTDFSGVVEAVGKGVTQFQPGDKVYGARSGAWAEYICVRSFIFPKPANITFEQAGGVAVAAITALQGLRDYGKLQSGQKVLINGASGGVGTFAVQIAKALGAEVAGVCSPGNVWLIQALGADRVIDYTREDFTSNRQSYDLLLDIAGSRSFREYKRILKPNAHVVIVGGPKSNRVVGALGHVIRSQLWAIGFGIKPTFFVARFNHPDFQLLGQWLTSGQVKPVVDRVYPLSEISAAMRYLEDGHTKGKIIVTIS